MKHEMTVTTGNIAVLTGNDQLSRLVQENGLAHDGMMREHILPHLKPGDWVVDGGAALGDHTACYIDRVKPNGVVFAFEPHPEFFKCLRHNAPTAVAIPAALWSMRTVKAFRETEGNVGGSHIGEFEDDSFDVPTVVLDNFQLPKLDFVKLDTEGTEYHALIGMADTIKRCRPKIVIEMRLCLMDRYKLDQKLILGFLSGHGYDVQSICGNPDPNSGECDILALPR